MSAYIQPQMPLSAIFNSSQWGAQSNTASNYVTLAAAQTITGVKTFQVAPAISAISNIGALTLPTSSGTVALTSQLPTNANYVDLTTNQTVAGVKTFAGNPVISAITNSGFNLAIPTLTANDSIALLSQTSSFVTLAGTQTITGNKLISGTMTINSVLAMNVKNITANSLQTNYISMYDNPIYLRGQNIAGDFNHYLMYGNVQGNSFGGLATDGPALVGYTAGVLGCSFGNTWALKWSSPSNINLNGQCFVDTANAGGTPWTAPKYSFNGYTDTGFYFSTNASTYKTVGTAISGKFISYTGINPTTGGAYLNVSNADATYMGGFGASSGVGTGFLDVEGYLIINGVSAGQTYTYAFLNSSGVVNTATGTNTYSILATGRIKGSEFNAVSSKKIKTVSGSLTTPTIMLEAINLFKSIPLSKYKYTDLTQHDNYEHYGLIAEDMPGGIYTDSSQSGYVPNIFSIGTVSSVDINGILTISLTTAISTDKLSTILNLSDTLCYFSNDGGLTFSSDKALLNLVIIDNLNITLYASDFATYNYVGTQFLIYGTQEVIPNITKNNYMELMACVVQSLLTRIEVLEKKILI